MSNPEVVNGGSRQDANNMRRENVQRDHSKQQSYGTEATLRGKFDREVKQNPGMRSSIAGKFRKF